MIAGVPCDPVHSMATKKQPPPNQHLQPQPMAMQRQPSPVHQVPPKVGPLPSSLVSTQGPRAADMLAASPLLAMMDGVGTDAASKPWPPINIEGPCAADTQPTSPLVAAPEAVATDAMGKPIQGRYRVPGMIAGVPCDPVHSMATKKQPPPKQHLQPQPMAMQRQPSPVHQVPPKPERPADGLSTEDQALSISIGKFLKSKARELDRNGNFRDPWVTVGWLLDRDKFGGPTLTINCFGAL